jgi:hypothetical protein
MASGGRYISPRDLGVLLADLRLTSTMFQDRLLEFLEQQRIVLPVARIRWPAALVIEAREGIPPVPATDDERRQSSDLAEALRFWNRFDCDPSLAHPLDRDEQPGANLISMDVASCPFEPWENFRTNIRLKAQTRSTSLMLLIPSIMIGKLCSSLTHLTWALRLFLTLVDRI